MPRSKKSTAILVYEASDGPPLPGEGASDDALIDEVVASVNKLYISHSIETVRAIGEYVLAKFFDGDPTKFHSHAAKHVSFRRLADRDDLTVKYGWIWNACAMAEQWPVLSESVRTALPVSHHKLLLPVKDPDEKERLAREAVEKGLSKRAFEVEIKRARTREDGEDGKARKGRKPLPTCVRGLTKLAAPVNLATSDPVTGESFATYSPKKGKVLIAALGEQIRALETLRGQVESAMAAWGSGGGDERAAGCFPGETPASGDIGTA